VAANPADGLRPALAASLEPDRSRLRNVDLSRGV
jgi:hypothetical protein